jgi:CheY-like chemotaxis protein/HPt (histidine-containing phosphotransfer) domain-containing protein
VNSQVSPAYPGRRILIVDDSPVNCQVALHMLKKSGCHVDATSCSQDAINLHLRQAYDLILMDCRIPGMDGYQTTARIRALETDGRRTAIIGWTTASDAQDWERCMAAGMDDVIEKPIRLEVVQAMLARWMNSPAAAHTPSESATENSLMSTLQRFGLAFDELANLYRHDTPMRIAALRQAALDDDTHRLATVAHILSGSCASIGADRLGALCRELEICCRTAIPLDFTRRLDEIEHEYAKIDAEIRSMLQSATL